MASERCETCKHWDLSLVDIIQARVGRCSAIAMGDPGERQAVLYDPGGVYTLPAFGCAMHEATRDAR